MNELRQKIITSMHNGQASSRAIKTMRLWLLKPEQICQFMPAEGVIYDLGCGFGLCSVAAAFNPKVKVTGYDIDEQRIRDNQLMFHNWTNLDFEVGDLLRFQPAQPADAVMIIDSLHYFPYAQQMEMVLAVWQQILPNGRLIIRDVVRDSSFKFQWNRFHEKTLVELTKWTKSNSAKCWFMDQAQWHELFTQLPGAHVSKRFACHTYLPYNDHLFVLDKAA